MKSNCYKREPAVLNSNPGPLKTRWRNVALATAIVGTLGLFHDAQSAGLVITTIAGGETPGYSGDGGPAIDARIRHPTGGLVNNGNLYFADWDNHVIRKIDLVTGIITTVAGIDSNGNTVLKDFKQPNGAILDDAGNFLYISDYGDHVIYKINPDGTADIIAGTKGVSGHEDGAGEDALFHHPAMLAIEGDNLYVNDFYNHCIRKIDLTTNWVETIAGTGTAGYNGDGILATTAQLHYPGGLTLVEQGADTFLYIGDYYNHRIRQLDLGSGLITTVAGNGTAAHAGDEGPATNASLNIPTRAVFDSVGNMYITDYQNHVIRKVDTSGIITTLAGIPNSDGYNGDYICADQAQLNFPLGMTVDSEDNLYIADYGNHRIRKLIDSGGFIFFNCW